MQDAGRAVTARENRDVVKAGVGFGVRLTSIFFYFWRERGRRGRKERRSANEWQCVVGGGVLRE